MKRMAATGALALMAAALVLAVIGAIQTFPHALSVFACLVLGVLVGLWGLVRTGVARVIAFGAAALLLVGAVLLVVLEDNLIEDVLILAAIMVSLSLARIAFARRVHLAAMPPPERPVVIFNPNSGGGKAEKLHLAREARARGIEPIELRPGDDLRKLVDDAIAGGADALAAAGGDGTQAIVASIAAEHGLPYACIPAGTRNHFALDLGVDRDDVIGALDAFVDGGERRVDLAEVNGRVFVNNVSLGVYAEAVQQEGYRDAKLRTLADTAPRLLGPKGQRLDLQWSEPDGQEHRSADVMLVSNDPYRLGRVLGSGTRPRLDAGVLGIAVAAGGNGAPSRSPLLTWSAPSFEIRSGSAVAAGIDGEAAQLEPPLRFRSRPSALRVRVARIHPGASPSASIPENLWAGIRSLVAVSARGTGT
jgi:diacylglycerol kinase family enzyme